MRTANPSTIDEASEIARHAKRPCETSASTLRQFALLAAFVIAFPQAVHAQDSDLAELLATCETAASSGDVLALRSISSAFVDPDATPDPQLLQRIEGCLSRGLERPWVYVPDMRTFLPQQLAETRLKAFEAARNKPDKVVRQCILDLDAGNEDAALAAIPKILSWTNVSDRKVISDGTECLVRSKGDGWGFSSKQAKFLSPDRFEVEQAADRHAARLLFHEYEGMAVLQNIIQQADRAKREELARVVRLTREACSDLYLQDPTAALTNSVCNPIFLEVGLPN